MSIRVQVEFQFQDIVLVRGPLLVRQFYVILLQEGIRNPIKTRRYVGAFAEFNAREVEKVEESRRWLTGRFCMRLLALS